MVDASEIIAERSGASSHTLMLKSDGTLLATGRKVYSEHTTGDQILDLSRFPKGIYLLKLMTEEGSADRVKIIRN